MLMADQAPRFETCPRCGTGGFERLKTHSYCIECNFFEEQKSGSIESLLFSLNKEMDFITKPASVIPIQPKQNQSDDEVA